MYFLYDCAKDIDECIMSLNRCDLHASCINTQGSYKCSCDHGYHGDGWKCSLSDFDYNVKIPIQIENTQVISGPPKLREQKYDKNLTTRAIKEKTGILNYSFLSLIKVTAFIRITKNGFKSIISVWNVRDSFPNWTRVRSVKCTKKI